MDGHFLKLVITKRAEKYIREALDWQVGCGGIGNLCNIFLVQGKFDQAQQFLDSVCQEMECDNICNLNRFVLSVHSKNWDEAKRYYSRWAENSESDLSWTNLYWAFVLKKTGNIEEADSLARMELLSNEQLAGKNSGYSIYNLSRIHAFLNQKEKALQYLREFERLEKAFKEYDYILIDSLFENLIDDPEFLEIVNRAQKEKDELSDQIKQLEQEGLL